MGVFSCNVTLKLLFQNLLLRQKFLLEFIDTNLDHFLVITLRTINMSTAARRRLMRDFRRLQEDPPMGVSGAPGENNIMIWNAVIFGPHETPFEDGTFKLMMEFSEDYPNKPPTVKFLSKMF